jgi:hypothetical protein
MARFCYAVHSLSGVGGQLEPGAQTRDGCELMLSIVKVRSGLSMKNEGFETRVIRPTDNYRDASIVVRGTVTLHSLNHRKLLLNRGA